MVEFSVALVPEDVAALPVEEDDPLGQHIDGFAQPPLGSARLALGAFQRVLVPAARKRRQGGNCLPQPAPGRSHATISVRARSQTAGIG